jgi:hypothetical protein
MVRKRRRAAEEEIRERTARRRNAVTILLESGVLVEGEEVRLHLPAFTIEQREQVEKLLSVDADVGIAYWTGKSLLRALRWKRDGEEYSASRLVESVLTELGVYAPVAGPQYWVTSKGKTIADLAIEIEPDSRPA